MMSSTSLYSEPTLDSDGSGLNFYRKYKIDAKPDSENNNIHLLLITTK